MGTLIDRVHRELTDTDLHKIVSTYHAWRGDPPVRHSREGRSGDFGLDTSRPQNSSGLQARTRPARGNPSAYQDIPGFCKSATSTEIAAHGHVLTPGRYVGAEEVEDDGESFEDKMLRLVAELHAQFAESAKLEQAIKANLRGLGYGG